MVFHKGNLPWNKGKINCYSEKNLKSNSDKHKNSYEERFGKEKADKIKEKISKAMSERRLSDDHKRKIGEATTRNQKGVSYEERFGKERAKEIKEKISKNSWSKRMKGKFPKRTLEKKRLNTLGEKNPMFGVRGEKHPGWRGGLKFQPYTKEFNKHFKLAIKKRDNFACVKCNLCELDSKKLFKDQGLQIHHINYDKKLSLPENCCTLCHRCNSEVNYNREAWKVFFQSLLSKRYGYEYEGEEIIIKFGEISK